MVAKCRSVSVSASRAGCMAWLPPFWFFFNIFITVFLPGTLTYWKYHKPFKGGRQVSHLHSAKWWNIKFVSQISQCWSALQRLPEWWCHCYHGGLSLKIKQVLLWEVWFSFQNRHSTRLMQLVPARGVFLLNWTIFLKSQSVKQKAWARIKCIMTIDVQLFIYTCS